MTVFGAQAIDRELDFSAHQGSLVDLTRVPAGSDA
jgi:hypothetical protein